MNSVPNSPEDCDKETNSTETENSAKTKLFQQETEQIQTSAAATGKDTYDFDSNELQLPQNHVTSHAENVTVNECDVSQSSALKNFVMVDTPAKVDKKRKRKNESGISDDVTDSCAPAKRQQPTIREVLSPVKETEPRRTRATKTSRDREPLTEVTASQSAATSAQLQEEEAPSAEKSVDETPKKTPKKKRKHRSSIGDTSIPETPTATPSKDVTPGSESKRKHKKRKHSLDVPTAEAESRDDVTASQDVSERSSKRKKLKLRRSSEAATATVVRH